MNKNMFGKVTTRNIGYNLQHLPQIIFEVTDACNLRCKYCAYADMYEGYDERENLKFPSSPSLKPSQEILTICY